MRPDSRRWLPTRLASHRRRCRRDCRGRIDHELAAALLKGHRPDGLVVCFSAGDSSLNTTNGIALGRYPPSSRSTSHVAQRLSRVGIDDAERLLRCAAGQDRHQQQARSEPLGTRASRVAPHRPENPVLRAASGAVQCEERREKAPWKPVLQGAGYYLLRERLDCLRRPDCRRRRVERIGCLAVQVKTKGGNCSRDHVLAVSCNVCFGVRLLTASGGGVTALPTVLCIAFATSQVHTTSWGCVAHGPGEPVCRAMVAHCVARNTSAGWGGSVFARHLVKQRGSACIRGCVVPVARAADCLGPWL